MQPQPPTLPQLTHQFQRFAGEVQQTVTHMAGTVLALKKRGINVQPILYPAVEEDQARLRFFLSSLHQESQLLHTANVLKEELERLTREMNGDAVA